MFWLLQVYLFSVGCTTPKESNSPVALPPSSKKLERKNVPLTQKPFDPLKGKSLKEICSSYFLSLIKWRYSELQSGFSKICCTKEGLGNDLPCGLDWPFSDTPSCSAYDELRNGIMASYGYPFPSKQWKEHFAEESWYQPREDYSESWLSAPATENIATLMHLKKTKAYCND